MQSCELSLAATSARLEVQGTWRPDAASLVFVNI